MEGFVYLINKKRTEVSISFMQNRIDELKDIKHTFNSVQDGQSTFIYYTNQYDYYPYNCEKNYIFTPVGQTTMNKNILFQKISKANDKVKRQIVSELNGTFLIAFGNVKMNEIDIFTHVVRGETSYIYESDFCIIVGSDPLIVSAVSNEMMSPVFDSSNFISFFELGYFADELTPYKNVKCLPPNTHIKICNEKIYYIPIDDSYRGFLNNEEEARKELSNAFLNAFNILPEKDSINIGLTGGKDSRLIFTALLKKGFDVHTFTLGFDNSPDIIIAKELAGFYNVHHETRSPLIQNDRNLEVLLLDRLIDSMSATSGQIYAYENIKRLNDFKKSTTLNGVGGEILRGGYVIPSNINFDTNNKRIKNKFYRFSNLYINETNKYSNFIDNLTSSDEKFVKSSYKHYLFYKMGRWASDTRMAKNYLSDNYMPFLDNQLIKLVMQIDPMDLFSGKAQFSLLKNLDKHATKFRFENSRFDFEKDRPDTIVDFENWFQRRPLYPNTKIGKYNWRVLSNDQENLINAFKEILLSDRNNSIYDVVDYTKIEGILNNKLEYKYSKFLWALASMSTFTNHMNKLEQSYSNDTIELEIPSDRVDEVRPLAELIDLTEEFIPLNNSVSVVQDEEGDGFYALVNNNQGNPYIKTFKGKFNQPPVQIDDGVMDYAESFRVNLTMNYVDDPIKFSVILYSKSERLKTINIQPENNESYLIFEEKIKLTDEVNSYRLALKLPSEKLFQKYKVHYSFVEIGYI